MSELKRLGASSVQRHPDGELAVEIQEPVRRKEIFIIQPTSPPTNEHLMELLALVDACRRASASHITAVIPYYGYARSDKRHGRREPIAGSMVAALLQTVGVNQVITVDLHASQIEGFFHVPVDSLTAMPVLAAALRERLPAGVAVVSPDTGRVKMATQYAQRLDAPVVILHKQRESGTETHVTHVVGDVRDRPCLIIDDMISTGGTVIEAINALRRAGTRPGICVAATHGLLLGGTPALLNHEYLGNVFITDTIARHGEPHPRVQVVSIAPLIAEAKRDHTPFLRIGRAHSTDTEAVSPVNIRHRQAGHLDPRQKSHIGHLLQRLILQDSADQFLAGINPPLYAHPRLITFGNSPAIAIYPLQWNGRIWLSRIGMILFRRHKEQFGLKKYAKPPRSHAPIFFHPAAKKQGLKFVLTVPIHERVCNWTGEIRRDKAGRGGMNRSVKPGGNSLLMQFERF